MLSLTYIFKGGYKMSCLICNEEKIITYKEINDNKIDFVILPPTVKKYDKAPVYFMISGGGWHRESKLDMYNFSKKLAEDVRSNGFAVVSIDYRVASLDMSLKDDISIAEMTEDVYDALQYLAENEDQLNIDSKKIVVTGHSAGGHLAALVAYADACVLMGDDFVPKYKIIGCVPISPVMVMQTGGVCDNFIETDSKFIFYNKTYDHAVAIKYSPYEYINGDSVPTCFMHGTDDNLVPFDNSYLSLRKGVELGADFTMVAACYAGHCFEGMNGKEIAPTYDKCMDHALRWIKDLLN